MEGLERKWWTLIAVCTAIFMLLLDITVVNVALPDIQRDLDASFAQLQWVVDAYALTLATTVLAAGSLADLLRPPAGVHDRARAVHGRVVRLRDRERRRRAHRLPARCRASAAAIMFAVSLALLANAFHGRERGTAFGIWGATTGAAVAIGPLVGGILTEWAGWRWIFFVNIPIGIAAIVVTLLRVDESRSPAARPRRLARARRR